MADATPHPYLDANLDVAARVADLIGRLTLEEKIGQLMNQAAAIERLGVPAYDYWSEALHGVARAGRATVFPQAIGLAATFDPDLVHRVATAISDEGRAKHHAAVRNGTPAAYTGLTFWSPNINIFRDPRWGRGHETYGEDPYLTARLGVAYITGLQGDDPRYLKTAACAKHFAVHSGPEKSRFEFDARPSDKDLYETYLPAFQAAVQEAGVENVMGAYNRLNGVPCCAHHWLLTELLRDTWGFDGHVGSDCGAVTLIASGHGYVDTQPEAAAAAIKSGCDLECGRSYEFLGEAVAQGLVSEAEIDRALFRVLRTRFRLGMFDPQERVPYARIAPEVVDSPAHRALAREAAQKSIVLLKNNGILPFDQTKIKAMIVTGPTAGRLDVLLGNYYGLNPRLVTLLEGIMGAVGPETIVNWKDDCPLIGEPITDLGWTGFAGREHDVIVAVMGLAPELEGELGDAEGADGGDRREIGLPRGQEEFLKLLQAAGKPVVLVLTGGSALAVGWAQEYVDAILWVGYPGEEGGTALGDMLYGRVSPSGRLPVTFYRSTADLPPFDDYALRGRTYRYFGGEPLYPFGFGLSYTRFQYEALVLERTELAPGEALAVTATVRNVGQRAADEVVQLYITDLEASVEVPRAQLCGVQRLSLAPGEAGTARFTVTPEMMAVVGIDGVRRFEPGRFRLTAGACSPGTRGQALGAPAPLAAEFALRAAGA